MDLVHSLDLKHLFYGDGRSALNPGNMYCIYFRLTFDDNHEIFLDTETELPERGQRDNTPERGHKSAKNQSSHKRPQTLHKDAQAARLQRLQKGTERTEKDLQKRLGRLRTLQSCFCYCFRILSSHKKEERGIRN